VERPRLPQRQQQRGPLGLAWTTSAWVHVRSEKASPTRSSAARSRISWSMVCNGSPWKIGRLLTIRQKPQIGAPVPAPGTNLEHVAIH